MSEAQAAAATEEQKHDVEYASEETKNAVSTRAVATKPHDRPSIVD